MRKELFDEPVSTREPAFTESVVEALDQGLELVILNRYANCGGYGEYLLVKTQEEFCSIVSNARPKTSISVFFARALPIRGIADTKLEARVLRFLESQQEQDKGVVVIRLDTRDPTLDSEHLHFFTKSEQVATWFETHRGVPIIAGKLSFWEDNCDKVLTAYVPDADGIVRRGAY